MRLYLVQPAIPPGADEAEVDARQKSCIEPIADLILSHLIADPALFGMRHVSEGSPPPLAMAERYDYTEVVRLADKTALRAALIACGDPNSGQWMLIRSLVTCRSVWYGYDGQAFLCLPHEVDVHLPSNNEMIDVDDRSELLINTDWMDGLSSELIA